MWKLVVDNTLFNGLVVAYFWPRNGNLQVSFSIKRWLIITAASIKRYACWSSSLFGLCGVPFQFIIFLYMNIYNLRTRTWRWQYEVWYGPLADLMVQWICAANRNNFDLWAHLWLVINVNSNWALLSLAFVDCRTQIQGWPNSLGTFLFPTSLMANVIFNGNLRV